MIASWLAPHTDSWIFYSQLRRLAFGWDFLFWRQRRGAGQEIFRGEENFVIILKMNIIFGIIGA